MVRRGDEYDDEESGVYDEEDDMQDGMQHNPAGNRNHDDDEDEDEDEA